MNTNLFINGQWLPGEGAEFSKISPSTGETIAKLRGASPAQVAAAARAAREQAARWEQTPAGERIDIVNRYAEALKKHAAALGEIISLEIGKPAWEAAAEVRSMIGKVAISVDAFHKRCGEFSGGGATTRFRPHGVVAVLGPFNFPGHLPNGHIVPALIAGNTILFKPSELAPLTAAAMVEIWSEAGLPAGVLNLVPGGGETGRLVVGNPEIDGVFFTGSARVGQRLQKAFIDRPGTILALEMGGNNALVIDEVEDSRAAAVIAIQSAFLTAGQRCTCARRMTVPEGKWGDAFLDLFQAMAEGLVAGAPGHEPVPFHGPVITHEAARHILSEQEYLLANGGKSLRKCRLLKESTGLLQAGIIDVTGVTARRDEEIFGPLLQVVRVKSFEAALDEANRTEFGLAAGLVSDSPEKWRRFQSAVRCGIVNWNQQTTGASSAAPFGGTGRSGNFRPSAYFAADYCSWPVASMENPHPALPETLPPGLIL